MYTMMKKFKHVRACIKRHLSPERCKGTKALAGMRKHKIRSKQTNDSPRAERFKRYFYDKKTKGFF